MANFKSDVITTKDQADYSNKAEPSNLVGKLPLVILASYTIAGSEAVNDTIQLIDLPAECVIVPQLSSVTGVGAGTGLTIDVGDSVDPDRYAGGINLSTGGQVAFTAGALPAAVGAPYLPATTSRVYATIKAGTALVVGAKLNFVITYRIKG